MGKWIPAVKWLANYQKDDFSGDLSAGIIVAIMLIPQGMAYAMLAGLPPVMGLYASTIPIIVYALFGSSRQLAVGPVAMVSIMVFTGVSALAEPGSADFIELSMLLALMVGVIQLLLGVFRMGFLVNFLSHAVISGFTSAAAIVIGLSQFKHLTGISLEANQHVLLQLKEMLFRLTEIHPVTFSLGAGSILFLIGMKKYFPKVPAPLLVILFTTSIVYFFDLAHTGVHIVGEIPGGLPAFSLPVFQLDTVIALFPIALTISLIGVMESIAMAKAIAAKEKYKIFPNQELVGLGLANIAGSLFSAFPVTGGFSRSAVNYQAGARTPLASMITAVLILFSLLFFTRFFYYLPHAVLAAIIIVAVYGLIDFATPKKWFQVNPADGWVWFITFLSTLILGIEQGIFIGAASALLLFIWRSAYPHMAELGYLEHEQVYRNIQRYPHGKVDPEVFILRIDASLYFANMNFLAEKLSAILADKPQTKSIIFDFSGVNSIDAIAVSALEEIIETWEKQGIQCVFANIKGPVMDVLKKAGWAEKMGERISYVSIDQALQSISVVDK